MCSFKKLDTLVKPYNEWFLQKEESSSISVIALLYSIFYHLIEGDQTNKIVHNNSVNLLSLSELYKLYSVLVTFN